VIVAILSAAAFVLSWLGTALMVRRGRRLFLDIPNGRSAHSVPTPRGGGIAFVGASFTALAFYGFAAPAETRSDPRWIPLALLPLVLVGVVDDLRGLAPLLRFLAQMLTACLIVILIGQPLPTFIAQIGVPATALLVALVTIPIAAAINFANFMDGLDGLVASMGAAQLAFLALYLDVPAAWIPAAAVAGFLLWNRPPARIFMGDTGSTFLGAAPILFGLLSDDPPDRVIAAWTVTAPMHADALVTLLRRASRGANVLEGHREHLYQRLSRPRDARGAGWSHARTTATYLAATLVCGGLVAVADGRGAVGAIALVAVLLVAGELAVRRASRATASV
jgi:UDP-N-acetylmuramyl pentapeptide phosphotransferase/UDP-N-acetylglucosamine-1-phosphate transferase